ncbi:MAG: GspE/PulE family protein [Candidatus Omnitrophica bacterium]|nr:GspE/PulE family protein [Candidatus Omnitrophota bacterium]MBU4478903.1 GspE/PulE family protein [Candidatus Omnitrophota bacterium]
MLLNEKPDDNLKNNNHYDPQEHGSLPNPRQVTETGDMDEVVVLSNKLDKPFITISNYKIPKEVISLVPESICRNYQLIPISRIGQVMTLAMADPLNVLSLDNVAIILSDYELRSVICSPAEIGSAIDLYYSLSGKPLDLDKEFLPDVKLESLAKAEEFDARKITELSKNENIVNMANSILAEAIKYKASDIHIEPYEKEIRLRYRIDGVLHYMNSFSKDIQDALIARFKILTRLDITQRRLPHDGRFAIDFKDRAVDFRVSILPINFGEKIVIRILDKGNLKLDLSTLGFSPELMRLFEKAVNAPYGAILITGPTGSGKSTTLYAILSQLDAIKKSIVTIENPIEYHLKGLTQVQTKPEIGLGFPECLRSVLRQNPDVIMVGEIRDIETADIAMKAALTGHLVLSTLHTNDAPSAIARLINMAVEPFLVSSAIIMVAAQRLCRSLCSACKQPYEMESAELKKLSIVNVPSGKVVLYRPAGCDKCGKSGYCGRIAAVEAFVYDDEIRQMILNRVSDMEIKRYLVERGMKSLRDDAFEKALSGITSLEEVIRATAEF